MYENFSKLLEQSGKKAIDVSRATGIPSSTFSDWKKGKSSPKQDKLKPCKACNFSDKPQCIPALPFYAALRFCHLLDGYAGSYVYVTFTIPIFHFPPILLTAYT